MRIVAGVDLGGTAVNYTLVDYEGRFLIDGLCEHPARAVEGPDVCLKQIVEGLNIAVARAGMSLGDITHVGLDTPGCIAFDASSVPSDGDSALVFSTSSAVVLYRAPK